MLNLIKSRTHWIKPKVIAGFLLIIIFSVTAIIMTYRGVSDIKTTREGFGLPSQKITVLNRLITSIYNEDSDFRMFVLTSNQEYLKSYQVNQPRVKAAIKSLQKLAYNNPSQLNAISKIEKLLQNKGRLKGKYSRCDRT